MSDSFNIQYVHTQTFMDTWTHLHINTPTVNRSGNITTAVEVGDKDDAWTEAVSPQRKAKAYTRSHKIQQS